MTPSTPSPAWEQELKVLPKFFACLVDGSKTFEARRDDRGFAVGNRLRLREWSPIDGYSGRELTRTVSYILNGPGFGIEAGFAVLGLAARAADASELDATSRQNALLWKQNAALSAQVEEERNISEGCEQARFAAEAERDTLKAAIEQLVTEMTSEAVRMDPNNVRRRALKHCVDRLRSALAACVPPQKTEP